MLYNLARTSFMAALALFANEVSAEGIQDITPDDDPEALLSAYEFAVVSFYDGSSESVEIDGYMEGAKAFIEEKISSGEWSQRSLGWFRINLGKFPELAISAKEEDRSPN